MEKIYNDYFKTVYKYLICLTHDLEIANDLTQETFCKAIEHISKFRGECKISVWLCEIAKNLWFNEVKKSKRITIINIDLLNMDSQCDIEEDVLNKENMKLLFNKIEALGKPLKDIFYMKLFGNLTFKEIGDIMEKSEVWARVNFYRGKKKLKEVDKN